MEERLAKQLMRYKIKLDPHAIARRYQDAKDSMIENMGKWMEVRGEIEKALNRVFEGRGIKGFERTNYRNFAFALFSRLRKWGWHVYPRVVRAFSAFYSILYGLDKDILKEIASQLLPIAKRVYIEDELEELSEHEKALKYKLSVAETEEKIALKATLDQVRKRAKKLKKELMSMSGAL
jgi:hypothetical protein